MNRSKRRYQRRPDRTYVRAFEYAVKHHLTLRELSDMWDIPHSTLHHFATHKLSQKNPRLYTQVRWLFEDNLKNWRGPRK